MYPTSVDSLIDATADAAVQILTQTPEGQWFERKSGRITAASLSVPMVAMANAEGGYIAVGIHDGIVDGVIADHVNELRRAAHDFTSPVVRSTVTQWDLADGRAMLLFRIDAGQGVYETHKGEVYLRIGDVSRKLRYAQRRELEYDRGSSPFDGTAVDAEVSALDSAQLEVYQHQIGSSSIDAMLGARNLRTHRGELTVAGWLLFGSNPQTIFPSSVVRVMRYAHNERGTGAEMSLLDDGDIRCAGSIPQQITEATAIIADWIPKVQALAPSGRFEPRPIIPRDVWLEGLVNAVLHRSYSMAGDHIRIEIFPNRIEIENPGRFPGLADPRNPLSISRYARNPRIVRVCSDLGFSRELGEGIKRIFHEMRSMGLADPVYTQTSTSVRLVLSATDALPESVRSKLPDGAVRVLDALRLASQPIGTGQVAELVDISRPTASRHLQTLRDMGLIRWEGKSARDPRASWRLP